MNASTHEIVVCMGSACFSRGNARTVPVIQEYLRDRGLENAVKVTGILCQNQCRQGPNLNIDGKCFCGVEPTALIELLDERLG
ncbi:MAG: (2Fe-2S) ferredoxin domain-containing protein [Thermoanaerobaculia bacterium]